MQLQNYWTILLGILQLNNIEQLCNAIISLNHTMIETHACQKLPVQNQHYHEITLNHNVRFIGFV